MFIFTFNFQLLEIDRSSAMRRGFHNFFRVGLSMPKICCKLRKQIKTTLCVQRTIPDSNRDLLLLQQNIHQLKWNVDKWCLSVDKRCLSQRHKCLATSIFIDLFCLLVHFRYLLFHFVRDIFEHKFFVKNIRKSQKSFHHHFFAKFCSISILFYLNLCENIKIMPLFESSRKTLKLPSDFLPLHFL